LVFDRPDYLASLPHIGVPLVLPSLPAALLRRPIFATRSFDLMGGWPYCSAPAPDALAATHGALAATGAVSFLSILPPDADTSRYDDFGGFSLQPLKQHFVFDPALPPVPLSKKARSNLRTAERHWRIEPDTAIDELVPLASRLYEEMATRREVSAIASMPAGHFDLALRVPGIETLAIRDADGVLGGLAIAACHAHQVHMLHILTDARAQTTNGAYLLMQAACETWGRTRPLYLGGVPSAAASSGVGQFKARWANRQAPVSLLTAILDPLRYDELAAVRGDPGFFPAYRHADGREHLRATREEAQIAG
jgi:hypothetical protein